MFEYERVVQDLQDKGYTEQEIEEYIRREVYNDKNKKYEELDNTKKIFFLFLISGMTVEAFKKKLDKTIKEPDRDYSKVEKMINKINPKNKDNLFKEPNKKDIEKLMFDISNINEKKARDKYIRILTDYYSRTQKTINKEYIKETEYLLDKVSKFDKIEKVIPYYDKKGRIVAYHDIASYNSMVYNTNLTNAVWNETLRNAIETENDLVYVPGHWGSCPHCFPYEDRVYSLTGVNPVYPNIQEALDGGLKHPNCKHPIENYNSRIKTTPSQSSPPEVYNALQKINALELKKRRLLNDRDIYKELDSYEDIDKVNQKIHKLNLNIKQQKTILKELKNNDYTTLNKLNKQKQEQAKTKKLKDAEEKNRKLQLEKSKQLRYKEELKQQASKEYKKQLQKQSSQTHKEMQELFKIRENRAKYIKQLENKQQELKEVRKIIYKNQKDMKYWEAKQRELDLIVEIKNLKELIKK